MALVETNTKDCTIGFSEAETVIPSTSSIVFDVDNMDKAVETLKQKGISFIGMYSSPADSNRKWPRS